MIFVCLLMGLSIKANHGTVHPLRMFVAGEFSYLLTIA